MGLIAGVPLLLIGAVLLRGVILTRQMQNAHACRLAAMLGRHSL